jgi:hypothetical protein
MKKTKKIEEPESGLIGADIGSGFETMAELEVMKFDEAMSGPSKKNGRKLLMKNMIIC